MSALAAAETAMMATMALGGVRRCLDLGIAAGMAFHSQLRVAGCETRRAVGLGRRASWRRAAAGDKSQRNAEGRARAVVATVRPRGASPDRWREDFAGYRRSGWRTRDSRATG